MAVGVARAAQWLQPLQRRDRESSLPHLRGDCHATSPAPPPTCLPSRLRAAGAEQANGLTHTHDGQRRAAVGERSSRRPMRACPCPLARRPLSACLSVCLSLSLSLSLCLSLSVCLSLSSSCSPVPARLAPRFDGVASAAESLLPVLCCTSPGAERGRRGERDGVLCCAAHEMGAPPAAGGRCLVGACTADSAALRTEPARWHCKRRCKHRWINRGRAVPATQRTAAPAIAAACASSKPPKALCYK